MKKIFLMSLFMLACSALSFSQDIKSFGRLELVKQVEKSDPPPVKTVQIRLNGIFMGECGNKGSCAHEPVSGKVKVFLASHPERSTTWTNYYSNTFQTAGDMIWSAPTYSLVCTNYSSYDVQYLLGDEGQEAVDPTTVPRASNVMQSFVYSIPEADWYSHTFQLRTIFSLGNEHKDNFLAANGEHWVSSNGHRDFRTYRNVEVEPGFEPVFTVGPFETESNRCHEYYLQFEVISN